jgi:uncharacterized damage-inducible protein DinB
MEWADALVWNSIFAVPAVQADEDLRGRLYHTHTVQWAYLQLWRGEPLELPEDSSFENLRSMYGWAREYYRQAAEFFAEVDAARFGETVEIPWTQQVIEQLGRAEPASFAETVLQVVYHTTYHRGQINTRLRQLGGAPPLTDFIAWIWTGRPASRWGEDVV